MADVIVKGMEMPESCRGCGFRHVSFKYYFCDRMPVAFDRACPESKRPDWCPLEPAPEWISTEDRLPDAFQPIWAAVRMSGRENWTIETVYDPYLKCPWGTWYYIEEGEAVVYAWMDRSMPEPPKEEHLCD